MKARLMALAMALVMLLVLTACGETRSVTCDRCGAEVQLAADSNITDEWILFCEDCEAEIGPIVEPGN